MGSCQGNGRRREFIEEKVTAPTALALLEWWIAWR